MGELRDRWIERNVIKQVYVLCAELYHLEIHKVLTLSITEFDLIWR